MKTLLIAHPDDEVIFFWWALKEIDRIVCCSSDINNPGRAWCKDRKKALLEVGEALGVPVIVFDYNSEFYRLDSRNGELLQLQNKVLNNLDGEIITHNLWGEYGHLDHILVNQIALASSHRIITSDIVSSGGWLKVKSINQGKLFRHDLIDLSLYEKLKAIYDKYGCWTWNKEPIKECFIYEIDNRSI